MRFDFNEKHGAVSDNNIYTNIIIGTGVGNSKVLFEDGKEIQFSNATPIIYAQYVRTELKKEDINVDINNYMNSTIISFIHNKNKSSNNEYIKKYNKIIKVMCEEEINESSLIEAKELAKKDMNYNFKLSQYRATMKLMELFSDYTVSLKQLITDLWNFDEKSLEVFKKYMLNYENCMINISEDISNKENLRVFKDREGKFSYLYRRKFNEDNYIIEKARSNSVYVGYLFKNLENKNRHYNYTIILAAGYYLFGDTFEIHTSRKDMSILGSKNNYGNNINSIENYKSIDLEKFSNNMIKNIKYLYNKNSEGFYELLSKLNGDGLDLNQIIKYMKMITERDVIEVIKNASVVKFKINFEEA
ncbi:hypothetical protein [Staphylococcus epidermidis]|uniref:hypothetical protein n=1 Tax=Staphylococcus epidermidis TaxID=1282 RepID=UPI00294B7245|nr:hypothetical protein [Staphylococcus epidermidis]MCG2025735.1 hypothetical protein [Staphylococcus epidermidis]BFF32987.1 hypothetical protein KUHPSE09_02730 [Staphylococcus epidermidis]